MNQQHKYWRPFDMKLTCLLSAILFVIIALTACSSSASEPATGELTVTNVRANMTLPSSTGSFWMEIHNGTDTDDALIGGEFEGCGVIELHDMTMENDVMIMREVEGGQIPIPAGETVELKRGGLHVMCIDKAASLEAGSSIEITLNFANAGTMNVTAKVIEPGDMNMDHEGMDMEEGEMTTDE
ncbi:MAG: copper chaperone PCu(A)C [Chloroflexi bacterium]|nr:copper chaperone PCu(A)C [Chloroflexota bacterium]